MYKIAFTGKFLDRFLDKIKKRPLSRPYLLSRFVILFS